MSGTDGQMDTPAREGPSEDGLLRFLRTRRSPGDLRSALAVVQEFKGRENIEKWEAPFSMWVHPEQLENQLRLLTDAEVDQCKDQRAKDYLTAVRAAASEPSGPGLR